MLVTGVHSEWLLQLSKYPITIKNFNMFSSHGHHGSKRCTLAQHTHTQVDRTHSFTHLHQHSYNYVVRNTSSAITEFGIKFVVQSASSAITEVGIKFLFWRYLMEGEQKLECPEKTPDSLPANRYHILEGKIQRPRRDWTLTLQHWWKAPLAKSACRVWPTKLQATASVSL